MIIIPSSVVSTPSAIYNQLLADIYVISKRPDLQAETLLALRKAVMKLHLADTWKNDIATSYITVPVLSTTDVSFRYSLDLTNSVLFPRYRKVNCIKEYNTVATGYEITFKELDSDRILDSYLLEEINYWYQAGKQVNLRCNKLLTYLRVDYLQFPDVTNATFDSWIARDYPDMVIEEAVSNIFSTVGKDAEAQNYAKRFYENVALLRISEI